MKSKYSLSSSKSLKLFRSASVKQFILVKLK
ncbi:Protein of unknown function [Lactobacillus delbrueckii subsp. bulgaricus]|nr:Protein of unknown function [Lactobacillus delbrueckii subsp. bulgaricus]CDR74296.1 Protein of unknown function [Lactobacillus delbrueckii subsp. bulgaricus]